MLTRSISGYILSIIISTIFLFRPVHVFAQANTTDTTATNDEPAKDTMSKKVGHQLTLSFDIFNPIINSFSSARAGYEGALDYYIGKDLYFIVEGGAGHSKVDYPDLKYTTKNTFYRVGINRCLLQRVTPTDWDLFFIGTRLGMAFINQTNSSYTVIDSMWGSVPGTSPGKNYLAYWLELNAGIRVELFKGLCTGWTVRGKFLLNGNSFKDLSPQYIAGYGRGDKNTAFDFNVYISYAIRWKRAKTIATAKLRRK